MIERPSRPPLVGSPEIAQQRVQQLLDKERDPVPPVLREVSFAESTDRPIDVDRYISKEWHDREVARMWKRVWQVACREEEIPDRGDSLVYEIANTSLVVVRTDEGTIRAFHNSCLHRGRLLREEPGCIAELRCPFHGFTWDLEGNLIDVPSAWDFKHLQGADLKLPEVRVACWDGWVFVCLDPDTEPLEEFLGEFIDHWTAWPQANRTVGMHIVKRLTCNWKVGLEAFIESYHVVATHPQLLTSIDDVNTQYDTFPGEVSFNRMISPQAVSSPHLGPPVDDQEIIDSLLGGKRSRPLEPGETARDRLAAVVKADYNRSAGTEVASTVSEAIDAIQYFVFPNFVPWAGLSPIMYRFRPDGDDPAHSIMDIWLMRPAPEDQQRLRPPAPIHLDRDVPFSSLPELGRLALIFDQDMANLGPLQRGLQASVKPALVLASYQESRIRHFAGMLDRYVQS